MNCTYGKLGSGFGLNGYLPAISKITGQSIILSVAYREKFKACVEYIPPESEIITDLSELDHRPKCLEDMLNILPSNIIEFPIHKLGLRGYILIAFIIFQKIHIMLSLNTKAIIAKIKFHWI